MGNEAFDKVIANRAPLSLPWQRLISQDGDLDLVHRWACSNIENFRADISKGL